MREELSFWGAIALVAVASVLAFKILATSETGAKVPGLRELADLI